MRGAHPTTSGVFVLGVPIGGVRSSRFVNKCGRCGSAKNHSENATENARQMRSGSLQLLQLAEISDLAGKLNLSSCASYDSN
jgi:flavin-binding protein dodecin